ncbi:MAG: hypothetical protein KY476_18640 [Planctomycetes bacterium]|nr:hypothetical protein [Planctomycetota bacterium]
MFTQTRLVSCVFVLVLSVLCGWASKPPQASAGDDEWDEFLESVLDDRRQDEGRYDRWLRERDERYRGWRQPPADDRPPQFDFGIRSGDVPAGQYYLNLPFGRFGIQVEPDDQPPSWASGVYHHAYRLVSTLQEPLRDMQILAEREGLKELRDAVLNARTSSETLKKSLERAVDPETIRADYQRFDEQWHQIAFRLERSADVPEQIHVRARTIARYDDQLHQIIRIAPAEPFDRLKVAALSRRLAEITGHLLDDLDEEARRDPTLRSLLRNAERVHRLAEDFHQSVRENAGFVAIAEEFSQFDTAWHSFLERVRGHHGVSGHIGRVTEDVWQVHNDLHKELYLEAPVHGGPHSRVEALVKSLARTAEHFHDELRYAERPHDRSLVRAADDFADAAEDLHEELEDRGRPERVHELTAEVFQHWRTIAGALRRFDQRRDAHLLRVAAELGATLQELQRALGS